MKVVKVYGALRKRLGQCRFELEAATPAQAIKALCVNFPGLDKWLIDSEKDGVGYRVTVSKEKVTEQDVSPLIMPWSEKDVFSITPVIAGAGRGLGSILVGVALVGLAVASGGATLVCCWIHFRRCYWRQLADCNLRRCFGDCCWKYRHWPCLYGNRADAFAAAKP